MDEQAGKAVCPSGCRADGVPSLRDLAAAATGQGELTFAVWAEEIIRLTGALRGATGSRIPAVRNVARNLRHTARRSATVLDAWTAHRAGEEGPEAVERRMRAPWLYRWHALLAYAPQGVLAGASAPAFFWQAMSRRICDELPDTVRRSRLMRLELSWLPAEMTGAGGAGPGSRPFLALPDSPPVGRWLVVQEPGHDILLPVRMIRPRIAVFAGIGSAGATAPVTESACFGSAEEAEGFRGAVEAVLDVIGGTDTGRKALDALAAMYPLPPCGTASGGWGEAGGIFRGTDGSPSGVTLLVMPSAIPRLYAELPLPDGDACSLGLGSAGYLLLPPDFPLFEFSTRPHPHGHDLQALDVDVFHELSHAVTDAAGARWKMATTGSRYGSPAAEGGSWAFEFLPCRGRVAAQRCEMLTVGTPALRAAALGALGRDCVAEQAVGGLRRMAGAFHTQGAARGDASRLAAARALQAMLVHRERVAAGELSEYRYALDRGLAPRLHYMPDYCPAAGESGSSPRTFHLPGRPGSSEWVAALRSFSVETQRDPSALPYASALAAGAGAPSGASGSSSGASGSFCGSAGSGSVATGWGSLAADWGSATSSGGSSGATSSGGSSGATSSGGSSGGGPGGYTSPWSPYGSRPAGQSDEDTGTWAPPPSPCGSRGSGSQDSGPLEGPLQLLGRGPNRTHPGARPAEARSGWPMPPSGARAVQRQPDSTRANRPRTADTCARPPKSALTLT